ncbi:MAG: glycosyltransferase family 39 protein [Actinomycetota bacterium]|nr:glycosyltransferase family 39 protein [Actinomycetota bacterium]
MPKDFGGDKAKGKAVLHVIALAVITLACLVPFINKAFNMDDPLFLWAARHIQKNPFDFYGFRANWVGFETPFSAIQLNPPLASYYIAIAAWFAGWSERALHTAFLVPALAAAIGSYFTARELCGRPLAAALAGIITPAFLVSATSIMCDVMMTAFWVWAVFLWIKGVRTRSAFNITGAAFLVAAASLAKYSGLSLIPLLLVYSLIKKDGRRWAKFLIIPVVFIAGYELLSYSMYGKGLLLSASAYESMKGLKPDVSKIATGLAFLGGCFITALFFFLFLWRKGLLVAGALIAVAFAGLFIYAPGNLPISLKNWPLAIQYYVFSVAGLAILFAAVSDIWRSKDAGALLLFLWITGIFVFAAIVNYNINARSVLPVFPAIGIAIARLAGAARPKKSVWAWALPIVPSLFIALWVARADYVWANTERNLAGEICHSYNGQPGTLWFAGHWGFQYYMQKCGGRPVDSRRLNFAPGDMVIIPDYYVNDSAMPDPRRAGFAKFSRIGQTSIRSGGILSIMNRNTGAGFYSDDWGSLPFVIGPVPYERYFIVNVTRPVNVERE